jgi:hypothetical protein
MIIPNFAIMKKGEYIARYGWWASIVVVSLSLMIIILFVVGNVDDISVWLWLLVIIVPLNGFILNRDYERRGEAFSVNSDGIYLERKKKRLAIPWNQVKSCYYRISAEIIGGCFWRIRGVLRISLTLVVERKTGAENEIKLGVFCCNPITIARCIDGCSGKRLFDWGRTKRRFLRDFILWILLPLLLFWVFWCFNKQ